VRVRSPVPKPLKLIGAAVNYLEFDQREPALVTADEIADPQNLRRSATATGCRNYTLTLVQGRLAGVIEEISL
jgi:hypothetical protein